MKSYYILAVFSVLLLISCSENKPIEFEEKSISVEALSLCEQSRCPDVTVHYVQAISKDSRADIINTQIEQRLGEMISSAVMPGDSLINGVEPAITAFVKSFQEYYGDFPNDGLSYELELENRPSYQGEGIISLQTTYYAYTGGAHGYGTMDYLNLDPQTGNALNLDDLIEDMVGFLTFAEQQFKATNSLNSPTYHFEDGQFYLPDVYGFTEEGMEFYYPTYELGSYADGPSWIKFSWEEIEPWLSIPVNAS